MVSGVPDGDGVRVERLAAGPLGVQMLDGRATHRLVGFAAEPLELEARGTHYGYVLDGDLRLDCGSGEFSVRRGMYFAVPGAGRISGSGRAVLISALEYRGFFQLGGPLEAEGRLRYIDGCSDSVLIPPIVQGDPCLNHLHVPPGVNQTQHTHPSFRAGLIVGGSGECRAPGQTFSLQAGDLFWIPANGLHSFHTTSRPLDVVAFHPDSDCGPSHDDHPMLNRTLIEGTSARYLPHVRSQDDRP